MFFIITGFILIAAAVLSGIIRDDRRRFLAYFRHIGQPAPEYRFWYRWSDKPYINWNVPAGNGADKYVNPEDDPYLEEDYYYGTPKSDYNRFISGVDRIGEAADDDVLYDLSERPGHNEGFGGYMVKSDGRAGGLRRPGKYVYKEQS